MTPERVDQIAQGRFWDGGTARQLGLVDGFGSLDDDIAEAARLAKLDPAKARPVFIEDKPDYFSSLLEQYFTGDEDNRTASMPRDWLSKHAWIQRHVQLQAVRDRLQMNPGAGKRSPMGHI